MPVLLENSAPSPLARRELTGLQTPANSLAHARFPRRLAITLFVLLTAGALMWWGLFAAAGALSRWFVG